MRSIRLFHYSDKPISMFSGTGYAQLQGQMKPVGVWLSVGRSWQRWCESEEFNLNRLVVVHRVTVDLTNILRLKSAEDIDAFTTKYRDRHAISEYRSIQWDSVAEHYSGILIAPYCWERRLARHSSWYYTWDCASGCVWDFSAIQAVEVSPQSVGVGYSF